MAKEPEVVIPVRGENYRDTVASHVKNRRTERAERDKASHKGSDSLKRAFDYMDKDRC